MKNVKSQVNKTLTTDTNVTQRLEQLKGTFHKVQCPSFSTNFNNYPKRRVPLIFKKTGWQTISFTPLTSTRSDSLTGLMMSIILRFGLLFLVRKTKEQVQLESKVINFDHTSLLRFRRSSLVEKRGWRIP